MCLLLVRLLHNPVLVQKSLVKLMPKYQKLKEGVMEEFVAVILSFLMNHRLLVAVLYVSYVLILFILPKPTEYSKIGMNMIWVPFVILIVICIFFWVQRV